MKSLLSSSWLACLLLGLLTIQVDARVVTFHYVPDSFTCKVLTGDIWNISMGDFHVDCGNANHGCTPGHEVMVYGDFVANSNFQSVADIDIKICEFGDMICTSNVLEDQLNVCSQLNLEDTDGYSQCNEVGNYTMEGSFLLPNHTWWEDLAFEGFTYNIYLTLDQDLECHGQVETRVYYGTQNWVGVAVGSAAVVAVLSYYLHKKHGLNCKTIMECGDMDRVCTSSSTSDNETTIPMNYNVDFETTTKPTKAKTITKTTNSGMELVQCRLDGDDRRNRNRGHHSSNYINNNSNGLLPGQRRSYLPALIKLPEGFATSPTAFHQHHQIDDESVTTHGYEQMLDFSPQGLRRQDEMEAVRQAHFERLRKTRQFRTVGLMPPNHHHHQQQQHE